MFGGIFERWLTTDHVPTMRTYIFLFAAAVLLPNRIAANSDAMSLPEINPDAPVRPPLSIEVQDPFYLYIEDVQELNIILDQLGEIFHDLEIGGLREWFRNEMKVSGLIVQVPVIKGQEHRYAPLLERYAMPELEPTRKHRLRGGYKALEEVSENVAPIPMPPLITSTPPLPITNIPAEDKVARKSALVTDIDWFLSHPSFNQVRYSLNNIYQLFPELVGLMGYMDKRDCRVHSLHETEFNVNPRYFVNSMKTVERNLRDQFADVPQIDAMPEI